MIMRSIFVTFLYLVVANILRFQVTQAIQTLHIGGLYPFTGLNNDRQSSMKGDLIQQAVSMAVKDVEKKDILSGYQLELHVNDTQCRVDHASRVLFEMLHKEPTKIVLLGAGCSLVSERIAEEAKTWNLLMVSYGSTSPTLSKKSNYPLFFRTIPSDAACNKARVALLRKFNWMQVGLIGQSDIVNSETTTDLQKKLAKANIQILTAETFADDPTVQVKSLKEKEARIIIGNFDERSARKVFCQAYHTDMYGARYAWLIPGWFSRNWWKIKLENESVACTEDEMNKAVKGYIACDNLKISPDNTVTVSGQSREQLSFRYQRVTGRPLNETDGGFAYDAVWAIALALNRTEEYLKENKSLLSIDNFTYTNKVVMEYFKRSLEETNFTGVTGPVQFTSDGDRMGYMKIEQLQGSGPPSDRAKLVVQSMTVSSALYGVVCAINVLCIILAVCFLIFNIKLRHYRYIKMSSPRLNDTIVIGCITMYLAVFLFGLDGNLVSPGQYSANCQARIWLTSLGFTTAFGAMFAKIWRVYVIFTNAKLRKKVIEDGRLFLFVGALLLVDIFTLSVWTGVDSQTRKLQNGTIEHGIEFDTLPQWEYCDCQHKSIWFGVLFATKGLLLLFGVFLAWETRHVKIPALNDSRYVGMSVYNVVILSVVGVPAAMMIENAQNVTFALTAFFIIFCTTVTLCLVFVPKFIAVKRNPNVLNTSGATSTSASQSSGESSTSQDKDIKGPKFIALAAENSNLKGLLAEKEEEITQLEARLRKRGVPMENIRRISMATKRPDTIQGSTPTLKVKGDSHFRDDSGSIHIEVADSGIVSTSSDTKSEETAEQEPTSPRQRYSPSSSNIDKGVLLGNDLAKAHTAIAKKYSLPPRARKDIPQIETRARTRSADNEVQEAYDNPAISTEASDEATPRKKLSLTNRLDSPFYTASTESAIKDSTPPLPSAKARYSKPKKGEVPDQNANELQRKGSIVLVSKSQTGETCFQVKTPADFKKKGGKDKIETSKEYNV
ncbi:hypothetical protein ACROYT_G029691 [Oculina patagonica]